MDFILDLLPALFIFWFVIRALRGSGRRRAGRSVAGQPGQAQTDRPATAYSGFEALVRRLEEAAAEAQQRQEATIQASPPAFTTRLESTLRVPPPIEDDIEFRSSEATDLDFRYIGGLGEGEQATEFHDTHALERAYSIPGEASPIYGSAQGRAHPLVERLRTPAAAREALLLKDILSAPRSRSSGRR